VHSDGEAAGTCGEVVASECALTAFIEAAISIECKRMGRDYGSAAEESEEFGI
jgi:hypothetical protein